MHVAGEVPALLNAVTHTLNVEPALSFRPNFAVVPAVPLIMRLVRLFLGVLPVSFARYPFAPVTGFQVAFTIFFLAFTVRPVGAAGGVTTGGGGVGTMGENAVPVNPTVCGVPGALSRISR